MKIKLDYHNSIPLCQQAVLQIKRLIITKQFKPGEKLPSVRTLSKELQLNPTTVSRIFAQLAKDGVVIQRPGLGVFVSETNVPFSEDYINKELHQLALTYLIEGFHFGRDYTELAKILDDQHQSLKKEYVK